MIEFTLIGYLCLALNIYYEARSEPEYAQLAVAHVTINRAKAKGRDVCTEVFSPSQFSWTNSTQVPPRENNPAWIFAQRVAKRAYETKDVTGGALWYHRHDITPWWVWNKKFVGRWGDHNFYKCRPKHQCNWR